MYIKKIKIYNFRNISKLELNFNRGYNIIFGDNAQGKTNLVESICLALSAKSFREKSTMNFIGKYDDYSKIELDVVIEDNLNVVVELFLKANKKSILINGEVVKKRDQLLKYFNVIYFIPDELNLIKGNPEIRRKFIDSSISAVYPQYLSILSDYYKVVKQKNTVLKKGGYEISDMIDIYNQKLAELGTIIIKYRVKFLKEIEKEFNNLYVKMSQGKEKLSFTYISDILKNNMTKDIQNTFTALLQNKKKEEMQYRQCKCGIQYDDINIFIDNREAKRFASQGQQRSLALSLKLSMINLYKEKNDTYPIVLLDDVMSELDGNRQAILLDILDKKQTFITSVNRDFVEYNKSYAIFYVLGGKIKELLNDR